MSACSDVDRKVDDVVVVVDVSKRIGGGSELPNCGLESVEASVASSIETGLILSCRKVAVISLEPAPLRVG